MAVGCYIDRADGLLSARPCPVGQTDHAINDRLKGVEA